MDVCETAFVIDYLRDWATKLNRIVILAIAPPSFEILLMFSHCTSALLTSGQLVYFGCPSKMTRYFTSIGFPCPKFKNPCDFYGELYIQSSRNEPSTERSRELSLLLKAFFSKTTIDLATHDHQSPEASAESSSRIDKLIRCWKPLNSTPLEVTKSTISPMLCRPSVIDTIEALCSPRNSEEVFYILCRRNWYELTNNPAKSFCEPMIALLMACLIGAAFFALTNEKRSAASDRIGLVLALSYYGAIPWIFVAIQKGDHLD
ncbi:unnamed protein product [Haemonchus placei]|uniref:ABC2_membrane_7 domain-containing protein n=1 Tax=Haemonchus placei TaxID=6290 RepID=A0A0N4VXB5_HAEPC|nr:unnamed protein product [Haemonchus placei]